ncbi:MAG: Hsp20/alpha crystallin family protein [Polyangiaceae bacterium]
MSQLSISYEPAPADRFDDGRAQEGTRGHLDNGVIGEFAPAFEVHETHKELLIRADVPGVLPRDISVFVFGNKMTVWGRRQPPRTPKNLQFHTYERTFGTFWRTFGPAHDCDLAHVHAAIRRGVLTITVPKCAAH